MAAPAAPSGPLVALCAGQRCAALRERTGTGQTDQLRSAVRRTRGAVLVTVGCLGPCHLASLAVVARRDGSTGTSGPGVWIWGIDRPARADALRDWVVAGGPACQHDPTSDLPSDLTGAAVSLLARAETTDGRPHSARPKET